MCLSWDAYAKQTKNFWEGKIEYTLRSINSIIKSSELAKQLIPNVSIKLTIIDHNSGEQNLKKIQKLLDTSNLNHNLINLDLSEFDARIKKN